MPIFKALGDNKHKRKSYRIGDLDVQAVFCTGPTAPSHFSECACIQAKDIPVILHHEFPVLEVPPEVTLVLTVPAGPPVLDAEVVKCAPHLLHSHLLWKIFWIILPCHYANSYFENFLPDHKKWDCCIFNTSGNVHKFGQYYIIRCIITRTIVEFENW
jgi:hypothetical protein